MERPIQKSLRIFLTLFLIPATLPFLAPSGAYAEVIEDWSGVIPWFTFTFKKSTHTGRFMDSNGSKIDFGLDKTPEGKRAIKLTYNLLNGGYTGVWNFLDHTVDISQDDYLSFEVKSQVPGPVRMAIKDDRNITYVTSFLAPSEDWVEVTLPLSVFVKDRYATPANELGRGMESNTYEESTFQNLDPYQQFLRETEKNKKKKKKQKGKPVLEIQGIDTRHMAVAEVLCGPRHETWGPDAPMDMTKIRSFCLSPLILGKGVVCMGPIEAFKKKKAPPKPTMTPSPTATPVPSQPQTLVVQELPFDLYTSFSEGPGIYQVELLDPVGAHFKTLFRQRITAQKETWVRWDGSDEAGSAAPPGVYQVVLSKDGLVLKKIPLLLNRGNP